MAHTALSADFSITSTLAVSSHLERSRNRQSEGVETTMLQRSMRKRAPDQRATLRRRTPGRDRAADGERAAGHSPPDCRARRTGCTTAVSQRGLLVALHLLHSGPSPVRTRRVPANRGGAGCAEVAGDPGAARRGRAAPDGDRPARAASHGGQSLRTRCGAAQEQAGG